MYKVLIPGQPARTFLQADMRGSSVTAGALLEKALGHSAPEGGKIAINGQSAKPHTPVGPDSTVSLHPIAKHG